jgi:vacuolar-type H+-ATPase subunit B/Vma2
LTEENQKKEKKITELQGRLIEVEQRIRIRHIELHGIEETESENVTAIVCKVAEKLGVRI